MRVIIADRLEVYRQGLRSVFADCDWIEVVGEADDEATLLESIQRAETDAVVITSGISEDPAVVERLRRHAPEVRVIVVLDDHAHVIKALESDAEGYLLASAGCRDFVAALRRVADGSRYIQTELARSLVETPPHPSNRLSAQQLRILRLVAAGLRNKQVATSLGVSETTVKYHLRTIYAQLDATSRVEAVAAAIRAGLVD